MNSSKPRKIVFIVSLSFLAFLLGVITGYFSRPVHKDSSQQLLEKLNRDGDWRLLEQFKEYVDTGYIDKVIRDLTRRPGLAGTPQQKINAEYILDLWQQQGLRAEIVQYNVLLSYPKGNHTNKVSLYDASGRELFTSKSHEKVLVEEESPEEVVQPFNAYSPSGIVKGDLVYVNYGRAEDFERLKAAGINVSGKIAIARYGKIFRGNKVKFAEDSGAIGVILYSDPADHTSPGDERYFPGGMWLPGSGVQRGNVVLIKGDQSTQGYPSTNYSYRPGEEEISKRFPSIPCHPIGYEDANFLLGSMVSGKVWQDWQGSLNLTYHLTGLMDNRTVLMDIQNENVYRPIYNVIAKISGTIEADRAVIFGCHRDAWVYGAVDPITGTSILMETARIFAKVYNSGWRPRRSIVICSWDAEEYGLVGSYEWVEDNMKWLQNEAVTYVNLDSGISGNYTFSSRTVPLLHDAVYKSTMALPSPYPHDSTDTLYTDWRSRSETRSGLPHPKIHPIGSGSDHTPFIALAGIPSTYSEYTGYIVDGKVIPMDDYPLYHTRYEQYELVKMIDPGYTLAKTITLFHCELIRELVDARILPLNVRTYAGVIVVNIRQLEKFRADFKVNKVEYAELLASTERLKTAARIFHQKIAHLDHNNPLQVRMINDKLQSVERAFIVPEGLPLRPMYRHLLQSPSGLNHYGGTGFPGLEDLLELPNSNPEKWPQIRKHVTILTHSIYSLAKFLEND
ncbi:hypothetical protein ACJMK2_019781 [Sinanodonta woodiana]|uniref:Aminopeptidase NAALADL1 n=1 Tax=Sinanodonta woodiana TaxID=1069815 RepID=A0ABD3TX87_SINWO